MNDEQFTDDLYGPDGIPPCELLECMELPPMPSKYSRIVMLLLRGHYANPDNYGDVYEHLKCYRYSADKKDSTLHVGLTDIHDDTLPDDYPGIYVNLAGVQFAKSGIGNHAALSGDLGTSHVAKLAQLPLKVIHVAKTANDAYDLAQMSAMFLTAMGHVFADKTAANSWEVGGISPDRKKLPSPRRHYAVELSLDISYNFVVNRSLEAHRIRSILLQVSPTTGQEA